MTNRIRFEKLDLWLTPDAKRAISEAARATRRSASEFVLESALARAEETLPDRRIFGLNAQDWKKFLEALDAPDRAPPRVQKLFVSPSVFEQDPDAR
jgi:uncharacterized protein (DUF1778 family)